MCVLKEQGFNVSNGLVVVTFCLLSFSVSQCDVSVNLKTTQVMGKS